MVKIRLKRVGAKKAPFYNIVIADSRTARNGKIIEEIGYYNPMTNPAEIKIDLEKVEKWIKNGAKPTDTVRYLIDKSKVGEQKA
ncbi:MAG: 30S ribosomal protein S16 [Oscillospiraceae bacterium]|nr:30S ribosomal protein S16 [Oscillospiraceae bacterium]